MDNSERKFKQIEYRDLFEMYRDEGWSTYEEQIKIRNRLSELKGELNKDNKEQELKTTVKKYMRESRFMTAGEEMRTLNKIYKLKNEV